MYIPFKNRAGLPEVRGTILGTAAAVVTLGSIFGLSALLRAGTSRNSPSPHSQAAPPGGDTLLASSVVRGSALYSQACASCHGSHAQGGFGPRLSRSEFTNAQITAAVTNGVKPEMPAFSGKYSRSDIHAVTAYVKSLNQ